MWKWNILKLSVLLIGYYVLYIALELEQLYITHYLCVTFKGYVFREKDLKKY